MRVSSGGRPVVHVVIRTNWGRIYVSTKNMVMNSASSLQSHCLLLTLLSVSVQKSVELRAQ